MNNLNIENKLLNYFQEHKIMKSAFTYLLHNNYEKYGVYNTTNSYHTLQHCMNVAFNCIQGLEYMDNSKDDFNNKEALILAALFHDSNHYGNMKLPDSDNIEIAINTLQDFLYSLDIDEYNKPEFFILCKHYIECTEFPHKFNTEPESYSSLIRDADILEMVHNKLLVIIMFFSEELDIDFNTAMTNQEKFINNIVFLTDYGNEMFNKSKSLILDNMSKIKLLFND
jgi:hypothetical protein